MPTLNMPLTGIDPSNPLPGVFGEIRFAQGQAGGASGPKNVLIIAPKTASGALTPDTVIGGPYTREADVITDTGSGSPAHRMARRFLKWFQGAPVYILCPTAATGSAVIDKITVALSSGTNPAAAGVAILTICNVQCAYSFNTSDTTTTIAAGLMAAVNNRTELPVTAGNVANLLTITGKIAGEELNSIRFSVVTSATATTNVTYNAAASIAEIPLGTSGAGGAAAGVGTISYTAALATILSQNYYLIMQVSQVAAPVKALSDQVDIQALPATGFRQHCISGAALSDAAADTLASGANLNRARHVLVQQLASPEEHYLLAANMGAVWMAGVVADPSTPFVNYGLKVNDLKPFTAPNQAANWPTGGGGGILATHLNNGVTPVAVASNGQAYVPEMVTTYCKNGSNFDYRVRPTDIVTVGDAFTDDLTSILANSPWTKITDDPATTTVPQPPALFATPKRVKARVETVIRDYCDAGKFDPAQRALMLSQLQVGLDPQNAARMNIQSNAYAAIWLKQFGVLVLESSPSL